MKTLKIENENIEVVIIPELGGRIDSLISKQNNKQWVWKNQFLKMKKCQNLLNMTVTGKEGGKNYFQTML